MTKKVKTFNDFEYNRPELETTIQTSKQLIEQFKSSNSVEEQNDIIAQINNIRNDIDSLWNIANIRHTINTLDNKYEIENDFFNDNIPKFEVVINDYYKALLNSPFKEKLEEKWGSQLFRIAQMAVKTTNETVIDLLAKENKLSSQYKKLKASASIKFEGKTYNLTGLNPFIQANDRQTRQKASKAYWQFFEKNAKEFDNIYDQLVKTRHKIAITLGYNNFVELGYDRMLRSDYRRPEVAKFRKAVLKYIVPYATELRKKQAQRIEVDKLQGYDINYHFKTGNPTPKGSHDWIVNHSKIMYKELSPQTHTFFTFMVEKNLLDLENKEGKAGGGYCTYIPTEKAPFIFSNFNGTAHDIDVLTHEAGHAFQVFESRSFELPEYNWPTFEACEIHSMSMEFLTWPWMKGFFKEDTLKYKYSHLAGAILFIPYGVCVDEFQHWVYDNPTASPQDRKNKWRELEKKYLPHLNYDDNLFLEQGSMWQRQGHIYQTPFYYIDYTLAQICAIQFWSKANNNAQEAFNHYLELCQAGGSKSFLELVEFANLQSPFEAQTIEKAINDIKIYLKNIDDKTL